MAKKNYGGHTAEQMAREVDSLMVLFLEAEREVLTARGALRDAEDKVEKARVALDDAASAFVDKLPSAVRRAIDRANTRRIREEDEHPEAPGDKPTRVHFCASVPCPTCTPVRSPGVVEVPDGAELPPG